MDAAISLHPFFMHQLDVGPIRLTTIAHAFNYRVTILRNGVKSAARVGRSRRAAEQILEDIGIPWGHQVAVMFQIVCALALEVPSVLRDIESLHGVSPNVTMSCEPWGHTDHYGEDCECLSSESTGAYVHDLSLATKAASPVEDREDLSGFPYMGIIRGRDRDRCPLYLISQGLTADCSWPWTCGGRRASCLLWVWWTSSSLGVVFRPLI